MLSSQQVFVLQLHGDVLDRAADIASEQVHDLFRLRSEPPNIQVVSRNMMASSTLYRRFLMSLLIFESS